MDKRRASIIIVNWNGLHLLKEYLPSVVEAVRWDGGKHEIIVVDNGSKDGSAKWIKKHYPEVNVISLSKNLGFGEGSNVGVKNARNRYIILLNNDMKVKKDFIPYLLRHFEDDKIFGVTCKINMGPIIKDNMKIQETGFTRGTFQRGFVEIWQEEEKIFSPEPVFYCGGGSSAFDREKFLELGGFDRMYRPFYYEDVDICYRAKKMGYRLIYEPKSVVYHKYRGTIRNFSPQYIRVVIEKNKILFVWSNLTSLSLLLKNFCWIIFKIFDSILKDDFLFLLSLFFVIRKIPRVLLRRINDINKYKVKDKEILCSRY